VGRNTCFAESRAWSSYRAGCGIPSGATASQRQVLGAGYMSNRGRQNVASYLALDLGIDWRLGADWFESVLTDYGACSWGCMCAVHVLVPACDLS